jgi:hypothetical protein
MPELAPELAPEPTLAPIRPVKRNIKLWVGIGIGTAVLLAALIFLMVWGPGSKKGRAYDADVRALEGVITMIAADYNVDAGYISISREGELSIYMNGRRESLGSIVGAGSNAYIRKWPSVKGEPFAVGSGKVYPSRFPE